MPVHDTITPGESSAPPVSTMSSFAKAGNLDQVQRLLVAGEDPNQIDANGYTPLIMAAIGGHAPVAKALLNAGAELEQRSPTGTTALMEAAFAGHLPVARVLLDGNANIKATDNDGRTALDHAACTDQHALAEFLLERGAPETGPYRTWQAHRRLQTGETRAAYNLFQQVLAAGVNRPTRWQYQVGETRYQIKLPELYLEVCALEVAQRLGEEESAKRHLARVKTLAEQVDAPFYVALWLSPTARASKQIDHDHFVEFTYWLKPPSLAAVTADWRAPLELHYHEHRMETRGHVHTESNGSGTVKGILR